MSKPEIYLFPDTNVFMHFDMLDEIDWPALVDGAPVVLCLARIVAVELDKLKTEHRSSRKRDRARKVLAKIRAHPPDVPLRKSVVLQVVVDYPTRETAPERLDLERPDDTLIASILEFRERFACDARVVSNDTGVLMTAQAHGLPAIEPPEDSALPPEPDERDDEVRQLRGELTKLQSRVPRLVVRFPNGETVLGVRFSGLPELTQQRLEALADRELAVRRSKNQHHSRESVMASVYDKAGQAAIFASSSKGSPQSASAGSLLVRHPQASQSAKPPLGAAHVVSRQRCPLR